MAQEATEIFLPELELPGFVEILQRNQYVVARFGAKWCRPCRQFEEIMPKYAVQCPEVVFLKIDIEIHDDIYAEYLGSGSIPHIVMFKSGIRQNLDVVGYDLELMTRNLNTLLGR